MQANSGEQILWDLEEKLSQVETFYFYQSRSDLFCDDRGNFHFTRSENVERLTTMRIDIFTRLLDSAQKLNFEIEQEPSFDWDFEVLFSFVVRQLNNPQFLNYWNQFSEKDQILWLLRRLFRRHFHFGTEEFSKTFNRVSTLSEAQSFCEEHLTNVCVFRALLKLHESPVPYWDSKEHSKLDENNCPILTPDKSGFLSKKALYEPHDFWALDIGEWFESLSGMIDKKSWEILQGDTIFSALCSFQDIHVKAAEFFSKVEGSLSDESFVVSGTDLETLKEHLQKISNSARFILEMEKNASFLLRTILNEHDLLDAGESLNVFKEKERKALEKIAT